MLLTLLDNLSRGLSATIFAVALIWTSYLGGNAYMRSAALHVRLATALIFGAAAMVLSFYVLLFAGIFRAYAGLPIWISMAVLCHRYCDGKRILREDLPADIASIKSWLYMIRQSKFKILFGVAALMLVARAVRALIAPPMMWDALTYQLVRPARWIQYGRHVPDLFPDGPGVFEYFPELGNVFWAWAMLLMNDDTLLGFASLAVMLGLLLGAYTCARSLGHLSIDALLVACTMCLSPAIVSFYGSFHVDNTQLCLYVLGVAMLSLSLGGELGWRPALPAVLAFAMAIGTKSTMYPIGGLGILLTLISLFRQRARISQIAMVAGASMLFVLLSLTVFWRAWCVHNAPMYPYPFPLGLLPHKENWYADMLSGKFQLEANAATTLEVIRKFLRDLAFPEFLFQGYQEVNFGPAAAALAVLAMWGGTTWFRGSRSRLLWLFLVLTIALVFYPFFTVHGYMYRGYWNHVTSRLMLPGWAALVLLATPTLATRANWIFPAAIAVHLVFGIPMGFGKRDLWTAFGALAYAIMLCGSAWAVFYIWSTRSPRIRPILACIIVVVITGPALLRELRWNVRHWYYESQDSLEVYDAHPLKADNRSEYTLWKLFDKPGKRTIALSAGWDRVGLNWYRYPLMGRDLQNEIVYVPIVKSGAVLDSPSMLKHVDQLDKDAWLKRLLARNVDYFVTMAPRPFEHQWLTELPEVFEQVGVSNTGGSFGYAIKKDALKARLAQVDTESTGTR